MRCEIKTIKKIYTLYLFSLLNFLPMMCHCDKKILKFHLIYFNNFILLQVVPEETDIQYTVCHCNHLTAFSSLMVPPNPLPRLTFALLKEGYVLLVVVSAILMLYVLGLLLFKRLDQKDAEKVSWQEYFIKNCPNIPDIPRF